MFKFHNSRVVLPEMKLKVHLEKFRVDVLVSNCCC